MTSPVFDKTDKGREEIATRRHQLPLRLRPLLVLIDGRQNTDEVLQKVAGLGLNAHSLAELQENGFIAAVAAAPDQDRYQALVRFYTETIKSEIGLRGHALELMLGKAVSVEDLRALRQPYLDAVRKAQGDEAAQSLRARLDQLLKTT